MYRWLSVLILLTLGLVTIRSQSVDNPSGSVPAGAGLALNSDSSADPVLSVEGEQRARELLRGTEQTPLPASIQLSKAESPSDASKPAPTGQAEDATDKARELLRQEYREESPKPVLSKTIATPAPAVERVEIAQAEETAPAPEPELPMAAVAVEDRVVEPVKPVAQPVEPVAPPASEMASVEPPITRVAAARVSLYDDQGNLVSMTADQETKARDALAEAMGQPASPASTPPVASEDKPQAQPMVEPASQPLPDQSDATVVETSPAPSEPFPASVQCAAAGTDIPPCGLPEETPGFSTAQECQAVIKEASKSGLDEAKNVKRDMFSITGRASKKSKYESRRRDMFDIAGGIVTPSDSE